MPKRKVLICGSTGFIGRNLAEQLSQRGDLDVYGVHFSCPGLDIDGLTPIYGDLTDAATVDSIVCGMDIIIQAAASTSGIQDIVERPYIHVTDNAVMNSYLLRSAYEHSVEQFVFFSCSVMYQNCKRPVKENDFNESVELHPNYYGVGWTKVYLENMCKFYSRLGRTRHTVLRNSNIYGPHDKYDLQRSHVFGATVAKVMSATDGSISIWGDGRAERDLLYVGDLIDLVECALEKQQTPFELFNAGFGSAISIRDLVTKIISASGRRINIKYDMSKPSIDTRLCLDISKASDIFGWKPRIDLNEGIKKTLAWYQKVNTASG